MRPARLLLLFMGLITLVLGVGFLVVPARLLDSLGYGTLQPEALTDVRATYGGLQLGFGAFLLWAARDGSRYRAGVISLCLAFPAIAASRAIGLLVDGEPSATNMLALGIEITMIFVSWFILTKLPSRPPEAG